MNQHAIAAIILFGGIFGGIGIIWLVDVVSAQIDDYLVRARTWREIDVRCSRERHPSFMSAKQVYDLKTALYDWEKEVN